MTDAVIGLDLIGKLAVSQMNKGGETFLSIRKHVQNHGIVRGHGPSRLLHTHHNGSCEGNMKNSQAES